MERIETDVNYPVKLCIIEENTDGYLVCHSYATLTEFEKEWWNDENPAMPSLDDIFIFGFYKDSYYKGDKINNMARGFVTVRDFFNKIPDIKEIVDNDDENVRIYGGELI